ncbi:MAG: hypothetical protein B1H13_03200 [Desulfobacteraceae bacterium 4484_190.3]|nr:MAG: hypothetical protein B1H13_03200 [Desulfobacteraceae bacterium 4484_190.3]
MNGIRYLITYQSSGPASLTLSGYREFRQKSAYVQSEGAYKLSERIISLLPEKMKKQRILNAGDSYTIMIASVIVACPMAGDFAGVIPVQFGLRDN